MKLASLSIDDAFSLAVTASKDLIYQECLQRIQTAHHALMLAEAEERRGKSEAIIRAMAKIDLELELFQREFSRISSALTAEARGVIQTYINNIVTERNELSRQKKKLSRSHRT